MKIDEGIAYKEESARGTQPKRSQRQSAALASIDWANINMDEQKNTNLLSKTYTIKNCQPTLHNFCPLTIKLYTKT